MFLVSEKSPSSFASIPIEGTRKSMFNQTFSIMSLRELLESGANVSVTVKLDDLRTILKEAAG